MELNETIANYQHNGKFSGEHASTAANSCHM